MELEENNRRMENLLTGMEQNFSKFLEQKFSALLSKMTPGKNKATEGKGRIMVDQTPILPTPPAHQRLQTKGKPQKFFKKDYSKFQIPNLPKIDLPLFTRNNPRDWFRKCNKYFLNYQIPVEQMVELIEIYLERRADK